MDSPQNHIWGPNLWILLHSAAERIGIPQKRLPQEEIRIWSTLLKSLRFSLPCPLCKKHYNEYINRYPIISVNKEYIRDWLYNLHYEINNKLNRTNIITIEQVIEIYNKPINFTNHLNIVVEQMHKAVRLGWSSRNDIYRTIRIFEELKRYYDYF
jgi:hypothetical protein